VYTSVVSTPIVLSHNGQARTNEQYMYIQYYMCVCPVYWNLQHNTPFQFNFEPFHQILPDLQQSTAVTNRNLWLSAIFISTSGSKVNFLARVVQLDPLHGELGAFVVLTGFSYHQTCSRPHSLYFFWKRWVTTPISVVTLQPLR
jgi:hypothetical protein